MKAMVGWLTLLLLTAGPPLPVVAVDAGHGGEQAGARGVCGASEKEVALNVSQMLATFLNASGKADARLVRTGDTTLSLEARTARANQEEATVFISIHANASDNPEARGVETYFLSRSAADHRAARIALRENDGMSFSSRAGGDAVNRILDGLILQASHRESQRLGGRVEEAMEAVMGTHGRGLLQAPFIVLRGAQMSAVLVEVGFLTNKTDCVLLADPAIQQGIARALTGAVLEHLANDSTQAARQ
jgi:N-acetylmuramoyl-L-alanine amidase